MQLTVPLGTRGPGLWGPVAIRVVWLTLLVGGSLWIATSAEACSTPVYRYAMYNWAPAPFFVFYFHHGEPAEEDAKVNQLIEELSETGPAFANLLLESVDLSKDELDRLPGPVKEAWEALAGSEGMVAPGHDGYGPRAEPMGLARRIGSLWGGMVVFDRSLRSLAGDQARRGEWPQSSAADDAIATWYEVAAARWERLAGHYPGTASYWLDLSARALVTMRIAESG